MSDRPPDGAAFVARVDTALAQFLDGRSRSLARVGPEPAEMIDAARGIVFDGGKRLRPLFALWGWRAVRDDAPDAWSPRRPASSCCTAVRSCTTT